MEVRLDGKSAIVTGGSKGLGLAIAKEFAASGADVAILARDQATLADAKGQIQRGAKGKVAAISCDVAKMAPIKAAYDQVMSEFGKIDIFVNNAGQSTRGPSEQLTDEQWQADLDLKLFAQIRFCRLLFPQMKERKWGRIISVLNIGAKAPGADSAPTSVSRAAQMAFTKALSMEGAPHNVLVNSLARRGHRQRPDRAPPPARGCECLARKFHRPGRARGADGPHGPRRGIRQCRDLPRLGRRLLRDRLRHQRRRRPLPGGVTSLPTQISLSRNAGEGWSSLPEI